MMKRRLAAATAGLAGLCLTAFTVTVTDSSGSTIRIIKNSVTALSESSVNISQNGSGFSRVTVSDGTRTSEFQMQSGQNATVDMDDFTGSEGGSVSSSWFGGSSSSSVSSFPFVQETPFPPQSSSSVPAGNTVSTPEGTWYFVPSGGSAPSAVPASGSSGKLGSVSWTQAGSYPSSPGALRGGSLTDAIGLPKSCGRGISLQGTGLIGDDIPFTSCVIKAPDTEMGNEWMNFW